MAEFTLDLFGVVDEIEGDLNLAIRRLSLDILVRLTKKTPVDSGRAKNNWIMSIDAETGQTISSASRAPLNAQASASIQRGNNAIRSFDLKKDTAIYIQNNLPYIQRLNEGSSSQAPTGFVEMAVREASMAFDKQKVS